MKDNELVQIITRTEQIKDSIDILLKAYEKYKDLGSNVEGGRLYECLLEVRLLAEEYQKSQLVKYLGKVNAENYD